MTNIHQKPLVSIITASYNCCDTIERSILSVISQDYIYKELIVIDGGSSDGTVDILKKYDHEINHWVSEPDKGVYHAMNKGLGLAKGEWVFFLGGDDRLYDEKVLQRIFTKPIKGKMVYGNVLLEGDGPVGKAGTIYDGKFTKYKLCRKSICQQSIFYHKSLFQTLGLFETNYPVLADRVFNIKSFAQNETKPLFVNTLIAIYSTEGISGNIYDEVFYDDLPNLIKTHFGLRCYLRFINKNIVRKIFNIIKNYI